MKIDEIITPEIKAKLEKLRAKLLKREVSYEAFKKEMLKDSVVKEEYDKLAELKTKGDEEGGQE